MVRIGYCLVSCRLIYGLGRKQRKQLMIHKNYISVWFLTSHIMRHILILTVLKLIQDFKSSWCNYNICGFSRKRHWNFSDDWHFFARLNSNRNSTFLYRPIVGVIPCTATPPITCGPPVSFVPTLITTPPAPTPPAGALLATAVRPTTRSCTNRRSWRANDCAKSWSRRRRIWRTAAAMPIDCGKLKARAALTRG